MEGSSTYVQSVFFFNDMDPIFEAVLDEIVVGSLGTVDDKCVALDWWFRMKGCVISA